MYYHHYNDGFFVSSEFIVGFLVGVAFAAVVLILSRKPK